MPLVNSMGFGHGPFAHGPFGHGPWATFPMTPALPYGTEVAFAIDAVRFEDGGEQRMRTSRARMETLRWAFFAISSTQVATVQSWFAAAQGPAARFWVREHRTQRWVVVRCADQQWTRAVGGQPGPPRFGSVTLNVERERSLAEEIWTDTPQHWWRFHEATAATSLADGAHQATSASPARVVQGLTLQQPGLIARERGFAALASSAIVVASGWGLTQPAAFTVAAVVQPTWPPATFRWQVVAAAHNATAAYFVLGINSFGHAHVVASGGNVKAVGSATPLTDNTTHRVTAVASSTAVALWVDDTIVATGTIPSLAGTAITSWGLCAEPASATYYDGRIADVTVVRTGTPPDRIVAQAQATRKAA